MIKRFLLILILFSLSVFPVFSQSPRVPSSIAFAGETISFDRPDLYERMDRELISFTYMHSVSILMYKRSDKIFSEVAPLLKQQGIPEDLKYLMAIESNLDPKSVSVAGAAGLWQFIKSAGQQYGLEINSEVDERYNTEKATLAACRYLKDSYETFGNWMTVAASYNAGQNGIAARLEDQHQTNALDLWLSEETSRYMFRVLAAKMFFERPNDFGFNLDRKDRYPSKAPAKILSINKGIPDLVAFAEQNSVSYAQLKEANLWLRDKKLTNKAGKTYKIIIPASGR